MNISRTWPGRTPSNTVCCKMEFSTIFMDLLISVLNMANQWWSVQTISRFHNAEELEVCLFIYIIILHWLKTVLLIYKEGKNPWSMLWPTMTWVRVINIIRLKQNGHHFADKTYKLLSLIAHSCILIKISMKFVPKGPVDPKPSLVQIIA